MPDYIISGRDESGRAVTRIVKTATAQDAIEIMRNDGCVDLVLHTDDIAAVMVRAFWPNRKISGAELIRQSRLTAIGRLWRVLLRLLLLSSALTLPLCALYLLISMLPGGQFDWEVAVAIAGLMILLPQAWVIFIWYRGAWRHERLLRATALGHWDEAIRLSAGFGKLPAQELAYRRALALAGSGRLDEALHGLEQFADDGRFPEWVYWTQRADIFTFGCEHEESITCLERAIRLSPMNPSLLLILAVKCVRHRREAARGRELLELALEHPIAESIRFLVPNVEGAIALHEGNWQKASERFRMSLRELFQYRANPMSLFVEAGIRGQLATALARLGDRDSAQREYQRAAPVLLAHPSYAIVVREYQNATGMK